MNVFLKICSHAYQCKSLLIVLCSYLLGIFDIHDTGSLDFSLLTQVIRNCIFKNILQFLFLHSFMENFLRIDYLPKVFLEKFFKDALKISAKLNLLTLGVH